MLLDQWPTQLSVNTCSENVLTEGYYHSMALSAFLLALFLQPKSFTCGMGDAQTTPLRSAAGLTVVLKMHSEDDHGKNTHLCETSYSLQISKAKNETAALIQDLRVGADDAWDRPLTFRIDGFSEDGNDAFIFISEGRGHGNMGRTKSNSHHISKIGRSCGC
jgi:hypothetical protein